MESFNDSISAYDKIFNKYNLNTVKNFRNTNSSNKELDELINHLSMERVVCYQKKMV